MRWYLLALILLLTGGCALLAPHTGPASPPVRAYHTPGFRWDNVGRILLMPLVCETSFNQAAAEVRQALAAELQALGRFEIVLACDGAEQELGVQVRRGGQFNEAATIMLARAYRADVIVFGTLGQYRPYVPQRVGLTLQAVSPFDAAVVASVDGLWDAAQKSVADLAREHYREPVPPPTHLLVVLWDTVFGCLAKGNLPSPEPAVQSDLVLDSPRLYHRFACSQAVSALVRP